MALVITKAASAGTGPTGTFGFARLGTTDTLIVARIELNTAKLFVSRWNGAPDALAEGQAELPDDHAGGVVIGYGHADRMVAAYRSSTSQKLRTLLLRQDLTTQGASSGDEIQNAIALASFAGEIGVLGTPSEPPPPGTQAMGQIGRVTLSAVIRDGPVLGLNGWLVQTGGAFLMNWFPHLGAHQGDLALTPIDMVPLRWQAKTGQPERLDWGDAIVGHRTNTGWKLACWRVGGNPFAFSKLGEWSGTGAAWRLKLATVETSSGPLLVAATRDTDGLLRLRSFAVDAAGAFTLLAEHVAHTTDGVAVAPVAQGLFVTASVTPGRPQPRMQLDYWRIPAGAASIEHRGSATGGTVKQNEVRVVHWPPQVAGFSLGHTITGRRNADDELRLESWHVTRELNPLPL